jgi:hypothetical protein
MTQPSEWAKNLLKAKRQTDGIEDTKAEFNVSRERMFQSKARHLWQAIVDQLKADCGLLPGLCQMSDIPLGQTNGQPAVLLQANGSTIRMVTARFDIDGHRIKVARSHVRDAVDRSDGTKFIGLKLMENDEIAFLVEDLELYTVEQVSNHIMESIVGD